MTRLTRPDRSAFTLTELLVVITIIGILMGLLLPAVMKAIDSARRIQCTGRQKDLGSAILQYTQDKTYFPGYYEYQFGQPMTWAEVVLPYLGRMDLWNQLVSPQVDANGFRICPTPVYFNAFVCPVDSRTGVNAPLLSNASQLFASPPYEKPPLPTLAAGGFWTPAVLSYVVNTGVADGSLPKNIITFSGSTPMQPSSNIPPDSPTNGVFHDHGSFVIPNPNATPGSPSTAFTVNSPSLQVFMALDDIKDGLAYTFMLSENAQAVSWMLYAAPASQDNSLAVQIEPTIGMLWTGPSSWTDSTGYLYPSSGYGINGEAAGTPKGTPLETILAQQQGGTNPGQQNTLDLTQQGALGIVQVHARPSSFHSGGVVATFCDGHTAFLSEQMSYPIYAQLMTPNGVLAMQTLRAANNITSAPPATPDPWTAPVSDSDVGR